VAVIEVQRDAHVATVVINRPEAKNSFTPEVAVRLARAWEELSADTDVWVVVLTGAPGTTFCAGADLKRMAPLMTGDRPPDDEWDQIVLADVGVIGRAGLAGVDLGKPLVVAANGHAIGAGAVLVMAGDLRVMARGATIALTETKLGLLTEGGGTALLARELPPALAREVLFTGNPLSAERAFEAGFVNHLADADGVLDVAQRLAQSIAANAPLAVQAAREVSRAAAGMDIEAALALERKRAQEMFETDDAREGPRAFMEKRPPVFRAR
jgi:enoyl-CoA hydratase